MGFKKYNDHSKKEALLNRPVSILPGGRDHFSWKNFMSGTFIAGASGGGKTSGPLSWIFHDILRDATRSGGLILCVKKDDRLRWEQAIHKAGRADDLVIIGRDNPQVTINALEAELYRRGKRDVDYTSALDLLMELFSLAEAVQENGGTGDNEKFWDKELRRSILRSMMLLVLAEEPVTIKNLRRILITAFHEADVERYTDLWATIEGEDGVAQEVAYQMYQSWRTEDFWLHCFETANEREDLTEREQEVMQLVGEYYFSVWPRMSEKTRAIIEASALGYYEPFISSPVLHPFCSQMSAAARPERTYLEGTIFLVDVPVKEYGISAASYANGIVKRLFQLTIERRIPDLEDSPRPVFLLADEYHLSATPSADDRFQSSCRSVMCAVIIATQSITNLILAFGKSVGEVKMKSLLSNLSTHIYCGNLCRDTNRFASELIGQEFIFTKSSSINSEESGSQSLGEQLHNIVPPSHFALLKSGSAENDYKVETIIVCRGKKWSTGEPFLEVSFDQRGRKPGFFKMFKSFFK